MAQAQRSECRDSLNRLNQSSGGIARSYDRRVISVGNSRAATIPVDRSMLTRAVAATDEIRVHLLQDGRMVIEDPRVHDDLSELIGE